MPYLDRFQGPSEALTRPLLLACLVFGLSGCSLTPLAKHTAAFSTATTTVVNGSENAYRAANQLYFEEQMSTAAQNFDSQPNWDPHTIKPLLTSQQLQVRDTLLDALKAYAQSIDEVENSPKNSKGLDEAAQGVGNNLLALSTNVNTIIGGKNGVTVTQTEANGLSTAVKALGEYLIANKVRKDLPPRIKEMDPHIEAICKVLELDITTLQSQAGDDYSNMLTQQDLFIRKSGHKLSPVERRAEIRRLPEILQKSQATNELLEQLKKAIGRLALCHHALAAAAQGNSPETLKARIADLEASGQTLLTFYESLPDK